MSAALQLKKAMRTPEDRPVFLSIPVPPSVNELFKNKASGGRAKNSRYVNWLGHASWVLRTQNPHKITGPTIIVATVERNRPRGDIDNRTKAVLDLLVEQDVIEDDSLVEAVAWSWTRGGDDLCHVCVLPAQMVEVQYHPPLDGAAGGWMVTAPTLMEPDNAPLTV